MLRKIVVLSISLLAFNVVNAMPMDNDAMKGNKVHSKEGRKAHFNKMAKKLNLSEEQLAKLKSLKDEAKQNMKSLMGKMKENNKALRELSRAGELDEAVLNDLASKKADLVKNLTIAKAKMRSQFMQILTDEQKQKFSQMKEKMRTRRQKRQEGMGGDKTDLMPVKKSKMENSETLAPMSTDTHGG